MGGGCPTDCKIPMSGGPARAVGGFLPIVNRTGCWRAHVHSRLLVHCPLVTGRCGLPSAQASSQFDRSMKGLSAPGRSLARAEGGQDRELGTPPTENPNNLEPVRWGDSGRLGVGDRVVIGGLPLGRELFLALSSNCGFVHREQRRRPGRPGAQRSHRRTEDHPRPGPGRRAAGAGGNAGPAGGHHACQPARVRRGRLAASMRPAGQLSARSVARAGAGD